MKGIINKTILMFCVPAGLAWTCGCESYRDVVDPCYPNRYEFASRQEVNAAFAPQVNNGHVLDQTVWNCYFEPGTDKLTPGGMEHLAYIGRRRPCPDPAVYLQTAQDIPYDPSAPDKFGELRASLDNKRIQAVQNYLNAQTSGRHTTFDVVVHDPGDVSIAAPAAGVSILKMYMGFQGNLPLSGAGAGVGSPAGGGGSGGGNGNGSAPPGGSGR
jgi:hypothetical protein